MGEHITTLSNKFRQPGPFSANAYGYWSGKKVKAKDGLVTLPVEADCPETKLPHTLERIGNGGHDNYREDLERASGSLERSCSDRSTSSLGYNERRHARSYGGPGCCANVARILDMVQNE